jgi:flavodoxin
MKKVLVIYFSQTGQLKRAIDSCVAPLEKDDNIQVDYERLEPKTPFPFPWSSKEFFDVFPECVQEIPMELKPYKIDPTTKYDLIILGYHPWYLSPSLPTSTYLQSEDAKQLFKSTKVVSLIACRNMWLQGQEKLKVRLKGLNAKLVGNIALYDRSFNLTSVYTILRWMLWGKKGNAGISQKDIEHSKVYGEHILDSLSKNKEVEQKELVRLGAITVIPNLADLEITATKLFNLFARFVRTKGGPADPKRRFRVRLFGIYLLIGIVILSPLTTVIFYLTSLLRLKKIQAARVYFEGVELAE